MSDRTYTTKHGTTSTMQTANIGATSTPASETDEERRQRIRDNDRRMKEEINSRFASQTPAFVDAVAGAAMQTIYDAIPDGDDDEEYGAAVQAARVFWSPASAPIPAGWDDDDEAEYQALLPTWKQPANQFHAISELDRITLRRVAERLSLERLDNLRFSLQERLRTLWLEERRQEHSPSAISNQQSPISNPTRVRGYSVMDDIALREEPDADAPVKPSNDVRRLTADEVCTALLGQAIVDAYTVAGALRLTLDNNQLVTISSPSGGIMYAIEEA